MDVAVLSLADYRALAGFRHELRRFLHFSEEAARNVGLEPRQLCHGLQPQDATR